MFALEVIDYGGVVCMTPLSPTHLVSFIQGHQDEIFIIEAHPTDPYVLLTAGKLKEAFLRAMSLFLSVGQLCERRFK